MVFWIVFILTIVYCARKNKRRKRPQKTPRARPGSYNDFFVDSKAIEKAEKAQAQAARRLEKIEREKAKAKQAAQEKSRVDILAGFYEKRLLEKQAEINELTELDAPARKSRLEYERLALYNRYNSLKTKSEKLELKTGEY